MLCMLKLGHRLSLRCVVRDSLLLFDISVPGPSFVVMASVSHAHVPVGTVFFSQFGSLYVGFLLAFVSLSSRTACSSVRDYARSSCMQLIGRNGLVVARWRAPRSARS